MKKENLKKYLNHESVAFLIVFLFAIAALTIALFLSSYNLFSDGNCKLKADVTTFSSLLNNVVTPAMAI